MNNRIGNEQHQYENEQPLSESRYAAPRSADSAQTPAPHARPGVNLRLLLLTLLVATATTEVLHACFR